MACTNCKEPVSSENTIDFNSFLELFENPLNVEVANLRVVRYRRWYVQVDVIFDSLDSEEVPSRITKTLTLGEIN